jgi:hypothetical protein
LINSNLLDIVSKVIAINTAKHSCFETEALKLPAERAVAVQDQHKLAASLRLSVSHAVGPLWNMSPGYWTNPTRVVKALAGAVMVEAEQDNRNDVAEDYCRNSRPE